MSAYREIMVWSAYVPRTGRFRLMARIAGRVRMLPVRGRGVPFDVDLGPDGHGHVVAVYSRCRREPDYVLPGGSLPQPNYSRGVGCDIYRYDFSARRESKVVAVSSADSSEYMPSIWNDRIAFARVYERRRGRAGVVTWVYTRRLTRGGQSKRVAAGPWGFFDVSGALQLPRGAGGAGVIGLDLARRHLALAWEYWQLSNVRSRPSDPRYEILLDTLGGTQRLVASLTTPEIIQNGLFGPSLSDDSLIYGEFQPNLYGPGPNSFVVRYSIDQGTLQHSALDPMLVSQATAGPATFAVLRTPSGYAIDEYSDLAYMPGPPQVP